MIRRKKVCTPERPQFQTTECGVAVLRTMLAHFGKSVSAREVRQATGVSRDCLSAADIRRAARTFGLICEARSLDTSALTSLRLPVVVHLHFIHFVVLEHIGPRSVRLNCPAAGIIEESLPEFDISFTGIVLEMRPGPNFKPDFAVSNVELRWWLNLCGRSALITAQAALMIASRAGCTLLLAHALTRKHSWLQAALALCGLAASGFATSCFLDIARRRTYARLRKDLIEKLKTVDSHFYVYRIPNILFGCISGADQLADALFTRLAPAALALLEVLILLGGVFLFDSTVGVAFTACFAVWLCSVAFLTAWRRQVERTLRGEAAGEFGNIWFALKNAADTKLGEGPNRLHLEMQGREARRQLVRIQTGNALSLLPVAHYGLAALCAAAILWIRPADAGSLCILVAAIPLACLRGTVGAMRRDATQIRDILDEPSHFEPRVVADLIEPADSSLILDQVTFGFNPNKPPLVRQVSMTLASGEHVGLTGRSGAGKSTLTELMTGLHAPSSGRVYIGGVPLDSIPVAHRSRMIARVDGRPVVFDATLRDNITLWDESISADDLDAAIRDAALREVIDGLPCGIETRIESGGRNLSGGQLQRVEIARALARNPRILILDDALDALDFSAEVRIRQAIRSRGCTLLLVTHRANSLAACDRVIHFPSNVTEDIALPAVSATNLSIFGDVANSAVSGQPIGTHASALCRSFVKVTGRSSNVDPESLAALDKSEAIAHLARIAHLSVRPMDFTVDWWWRTDFGRALAFRKDGTPVALIPRWNRTGVFDPDTGRTHWLDSASALLEPNAWTFSVEQDHVPVSLGKWYRSLFVAASSQIVIASVLTLAASFCLLFALTSGLPGPRPLAFLLAFATLLLVAFRSEACSRARVLLNSAQRRMIRALLLAADPDLDRIWSPRQVSLGIRGLSNLCADVLDGIDRGLGGLLLLVVLLCGIAHNNPRSAAIVFIVCSAAIAVQAGFARVETSLRARAEASQFRGRDYLDTVLTGIRRLQSFNRLTCTLDRWAQFDCESHRLLARCSLVRGAGISCRFTLALAPVVFACFADRFISPLEIILSILAGLTSLSLGSFVANWMRGATVRSTAAALLKLDHERGTYPVAAPASIHSSAISYQYTNVKDVLFDRLSLTIDPRLISVLAGPSGAGKTTLLRLLLHFLRPQQGCIRLASTPVDQVDMRLWRRGIAGVFQGDALDSAITIRGHLAANGIYSLAKIWSALEFVELAEEVRAMPMGLQTIVGPSSLSNGQQQRLLIARALLADPALLVLDEATNGIPELQQSRIITRLRTSGIGCLIVSHRHSVIQAADTVFFIDHGLLYSGSPAGLGGFAGIVSSHEEELEPEIGSRASDVRSHSIKVGRPRHPFRPEAVANYERPLVLTIPLMVRPLI